MIPLLQPVADHVLSALVTATIQGVVLTLVVGMVLAGLRRWNAATRHAVLFLTLLAVTALPVLHALHPTFRSRPSASDTATEPCFDLDLAPSELTPSAPASGNSFAPGAAPAARAQPEASRPIVTLPRGVTVVLLTVWAFLAGVRSLRLAGQCVALVRLKQRGTLPPESLAREFDAVRNALALARPVAVRVLPDLPTPIAAGLTRPTILVPEALLALPPADQRSVLRHELAHLLRRDDWTNLFQQAARAVLFFDPAVLWISRRLTLEREIACDDHVLAAASSPREYAVLLTDFAGRRPSRAWAVAPAAWSNPSQLKERIHMILHPRRNASPRLAWKGAGTLGSAAALLAALGLQAGPRLALAEIETPPSLVGPERIAPEPRGPEAVRVARPTSLPDGGGPASATNPRPATPAEPLPLLGGAPPPPPLSPPPQTTPPPTGLTAPPGPPAATLPPADPAKVNLDRRLRRLENLVESLLTQDADGPRDERAARSLVRELDVLAEESFDLSLAPQEAGETANVRRHREAMERAVREAERATREAERALERDELAREKAREAWRRQQGSRREALEGLPALPRHSPGAAPLDHQRRLLEQQRAALQEHLRQIEARIRELDQKARQPQGDADPSVGKGKDGAESAPQSAPPSRTPDDPARIRF